ncbi:MAG: FAD:protein FMN transferase ApbE, partial [Candidatus Dadabacteria bacterium]|nr:FAD:protein FMN transferase ApbE [Candidatus Dadabacteria bacterium]
DDLYKVITTAVKISQLSHGAFDITVGPLVNLWGFGPRGKPEIIPSESTINSVLKNVGYSFLHLHQSIPA